MLITAYDRSADPCTNSILINTEDIPGISGRDRMPDPLDNSLGEMFIFKGHCLVIEMVIKKETDITAKG